MTDPIGMLVAALMGGIFGGGGVLGYLAWRGDALRKDLLEMRRLHTECEEKYKVLNVRLEAIESTQPDNYIARWTKDEGKRLTWMNDKAFMTIFAPLGYTRKDLDGKTFDDLLLNENARLEIARMDRLALTNPDSPVSAVVQLHPDLPTMHVVKVATTGAFGEMCYHGFAYRIMDKDITASMGMARQARQRTASADRLIDERQADHEEKDK